MLTILLLLLIQTSGVPTTTIPSITPVNPNVDINKLKLLTDMGFGTVLLYFFHFIVICYF
jgi:hypothetical protein